MTPLWGHSLKSSCETLRKALGHLPELARELEHPSTGLRAALSEVIEGTPSTQEWTLALDELEDSE